MHLSSDHIFKTLWNTRSDLRQLAQNNLALFKEFVALRAASEYPPLREWLSDDLIRRWDEDKEGYQDVGEWPRLNGLIYAAWASRPDLQAAFDLRQPAGRQGMSDWFILHGLQELQLAPFVGRRLLSQLNEPASPSHLAQMRRPPGEPALTRMMLRVWERRKDVQIAFPRRDAASYEGFLIWYYIFGAVELGHVPLIDRTCAEWLAAPIDPKESKHRLTTKPAVGKWLTSLLSAFRPPLQKVWPDQPLTSAETVAARLRETKKISLGSEGYPRILVWLAHFHPQLATEIATVDSMQARSWMMTEQAGRTHSVLRRIAEALGPTQVPRPSGPSVTSVTLGSPQTKPFGVNLIGYARGQFGIGEDVRMAVRACQAAGIPFSVYNIEPGLEVSQNDSSIVEHISSEQPYQINLFCTTGIETALLLVRQGKKVFEGHYNIGYWPWELPEWPEAWHHAYELVDEIWASSRYTYDAYRRSSPVPVRYMPMAVALEQTEHLTRRDFNLPPDDFLFVYGFDFLSHATRKNPFAAIEAFLLAFPDGQEPAGLVIKVMRAEQRPEEWQRLQQATATDPRIYCITETLSRGALLDLYRACDAFISLHRSEGFGRNIAEAMGLGKPTIVTGYSGNMDFTTLATAAVVDYSVVQLKEGDYPFGEGLKWAEPNVVQAGHLMSRLVQDPHYRESLAANARRMITTQYDPAVVGQKYRLVLESLASAGMTSK